METLFYGGKWKFLVCEIPYPWALLFFKDLIYTNLISYTKKKPFRLNIRDAEVAWIPMQRRDPVRICRMIIYRTIAHTSNPLIHPLGDVLFQHPQGGPKGRRFRPSPEGRNLVKIHVQSANLPRINTHILPFLPQNIAPGPSKTRIWYWFLHKKVIQGYIVGILLKKFWGMY